MTPSPSNPTRRLRMPFAYNLGLAAFAKLTALFTLVLIGAGALITGNKAALSDPTWPKFAGSWLPRAETWVGGLRYEDTHRVIAATTGMLTLILAIWMQLRESRPFLRKLGWSAVLLVVAQALFGGLIIHSYRAPWVSMVHACLAQAFFLLTLSIAVLTSRSWMPASGSAAQLSVQRPGNRSMVLTVKIVAAIVYFQLIMGAGVRHSDVPEAPFIWHLLSHILGGILVVVAIGWVIARVQGEYRDVAPLRRFSTAAGLLLILQVSMGIWSIWANRARLEPQMPSMHHILISTTHVVTGAIILALTLYIALRASQILDVAPRSVVATTDSSGATQLSGEAHA